MTKQQIVPTALLILGVFGTSCSHHTMSPPATGILFFQIDGGTCKGTHSTYFEIDAGEVGPEILAPSQTSSGYVVNEGTRGTRARIVDYVGGSSDLWTVNNHVTVPGNGSAMVVIVC